MSETVATATVTMTDAAKEARKAYRRQWAKNNKDKVRAAQERYWNKRAEQMQTAQEG